MSSGGITVAIGTTPADGLIEAIPQQWAGFRSDPPMSLPSPIGLIPDASAAASPPLDPPAVTCGFHGLRREPVERGVGVDAESEVGEVGAGEGDRSGGAHAGDGRRVDGGHRFGEGPDALGGRRPGDVDVLLHGARHAVERTEITTVGDGPIGRVGGGQRLVGEQPDDRVERGH